MNAKLCKKIRKQAKVVLVEWFKTLLPEEETKGVTVNNIENFLASQTHLFANNKIKLSAYSLKWTEKKIKSLIRRTNMDINLVRLEHLE
jgi:pantothenate kinase-related protein Tda10